MLNSVIPGTYQLRPYQLEAVASITASWNQFDRVLVVAPTGSGKTVVFAQVAKQRLNNGHAVMSPACGAIDGATVGVDKRDKRDFVAERRVDRLVIRINRQADANSDNATPILGERANNTGFLIDGLPNQNELNGGPAAQFNQDTIAEFQVITTGYNSPVSTVMTSVNTTAIRNCVPKPRKTREFIVVISKSPVPSPQS